jgi:predicted ATPase
MMLLFMLNGEYDAALKQYDQCRQILADELGIEASSKTIALFQKIRRHTNGEPAGQEPHRDSGRPAPPGPVPHNIPGQATPFIGREREQRAIDNVLNDRSARLITIFGVGGSGKTRLALAIGRKQTQMIERDGGFRFPDGVFFTPLEAVESPTELVPALCRAIGFQPAEESRAGRSAEQQLIDHLRRKRLLLIIDNFEQLMDKVELLARIRRSAEDVHLLVTSRQKLNLHGERLYALDGLRYPDANERKMQTERLLADYSAVALFVASARRVKPDFHLQDEEAPALIDLCRLVEGLPLAVELAAGWTYVLSIGDILAEIEQGLSFLESDLADLPDRHRSMEAVFEVTWRRLAADEQQLFAQLCVFRGGFTRQAATEVVGASLRQLANLANKALIQYDKTRDRYQVHRLLRQFGVDKLASIPGLEASTRDRHCSYYCKALGRWDAQLKGARQLDTLAEMDKESANVRAAWHCAIEARRFSRVDGAADGLGRFYLWRRRFHEGEVANELAAEGLSQDIATKEIGENTAGLERILTKIRLWQSVFCGREKADLLVNQALGYLLSPELVAVENLPERAFGLQRAGDLAFDNDSEEARRFYRQSLVLYCELGDASGTAKVLTALGWSAAHHGEMEEARRLGEEALALGRANGDRKRTADALWLLGVLAILDDQAEEASQLIGESLDLREMLGDRITDIAAGPLDLGMTLTWIGRVAEADAVREETLALYEAQGQPGQIAIAHVRLGMSKIHSGQLEEAACHSQFGLEQCRRLGDRRGIGLALFNLGSLALLERADDEAESFLKESVACFREIEGAFEVGWPLGSYAEALRRLGRPSEAKRNIHQAFGTASGVFGMVTNLLGLLVYLNLLADEDQYARAVEIGALLEKLPFVRASIATRAIYKTRLEAIKATLPPEVVAEAEGLGRERDLQGTAAEVLAELEVV